MKNWVIEEMWQFSEIRGKNQMSVELLINKVKWRGAIRWRFHIYIVTFRH